MDPCMNNRYEVGVYLNVTNPGMSNVVGFGLAPWID